MTAVNDHRSALAAARAAEDEDFWRDLMPEAAQLIVTAGYASPRMLQRKMRVSWDLAGDLLLELHEAGVVGPRGEDGSRDVLADPSELADVLAKLATLAGEDPPAEVVDLDEVTATVSLVKTRQPPGEPDGEPGDLPDDEPGGELAIRQDNDLAEYQPGEVEVARPPRRPVIKAVARVRHVTAQGAVWVAQKPAVSRSVAVGRQLPGAGKQLVKAAPHGVTRVGKALRNYLVDTNSAQLMAYHSENREGEAFAKVAHGRAELNLASRRWLVGVVAGALAIYCFALWAPSMFAGVLTTVVFVGVVAMVPRRQPQDFVISIGLAGVTAAITWVAGPHLAGLVPRAPAWPWWVWGTIVALAVLALGWLGRPDAPLVEIPHTYEIAAPQRPTAEMVIDALCRLGIKDLTPNKLEEVHAETRVVAPGVARSRRGYHVQLELPWAVTAGLVMEKREQLAAALKRELGTVWPSQGPRHPGHLVLFLSDLPMSTAPQERWPVAESRKVDIFDPIPMFTDQEGCWVKLQIAYKRILLGGESGSGKSFYVRQIGVAAGLDPRTRLVVFDGKANGDMDPLLPIAHGFYVGAQPEEMAEQLAAAQAIEREMDRRARFLRTLPREENPENKVTSALVDRFRDLAPYIVIVDELQEYTQNEDKAMAKEFARIFTRFSRLGRSAGIIVVIATQYPADGVVPVAMRSNFSTKFCLRVEGHSQVEVILGTGAYAAGLKANLFTASEAGLAWHKGDGQDPAIVQSVRGLDGPACDELVQVARAIRAARGLLTGQAAEDGVLEAEVVYDIAEDAERAMQERGRGTVQWEELLPWLRELRGQYAALTKEELSASIRSAGIRVRDVRIDGATRKGIYISDLRERGRGASG